MSATNTALLDTDWLLLSVCHAASASSHPDIYSLHRHTNGRSLSVISCLSVCLFVRASFHKGLLPSSRGRRRMRKLSGESRSLPSVRVPSSLWTVGRSGGLSLAFCLLPAERVDGSLFPTQPAQAANEHSSNDVVHIMCSAGRMCAPPKYTISM